MFAGIRDQSPEAFEDLEQVVPREEWVHSTSMTLLFHHVGQCCVLKHTTEGEDRQSASPRAHLGSAGCPGSAEARKR